MNGEFIRSFVRMNLLLVVAVERDANEDKEGQAKGDPHKENYAKDCEEVDHYFAFCSRSNFRTRLAKRSQVAWSLQLNSESSKCIFLKQMAPIFHSA